MSAMAEQVLCHVCGIDLSIHDSYIVRIDVMADPTVPEMSSDDPGNSAETYRALIEQLKHLSAEEMNDQVFKRFEYRLCPICHKRFLQNPMGMPRRRRPGMN